MADVWCCFFQINFIYLLQAALRNIDEIIGSILKWFVKQTGMLELFVIVKGRVTMLDLVVLDLLMEMEEEMEMDIQEAVNNVN